MTSATSERSRTGRQAFVAHRLLVCIIFASVGALVWIALYQTFYSAMRYDSAAAFSRVALLFALVQVAIALVAPFAAGQLRHGARRAILFSVLAFTGALLSLAIYLQSPVGLVGSFALVAFALLWAWHRGAYRVPYVLVSHHMRAQGRRQFLSIVVLALAPVAAGFALDAGVSWPSVLITAAAVALASLLPLARMPDAYESFAWGYRETFGRVFAREHRAVALRAFWHGIEEAALTLAWPITIFLVSGRSYALSGAVLGVSFIAGRAAHSLGSRFPQPAYLRDSVPIAATVAGSAWVLRLVAGTPVHAFAIDAFAFGTRRPHAAPGAAVQTIDGGSYIDEHTVLKEVATAGGRLVAALLAAALAAYGSVSLALVGIFLAAAIAAGWSVVLARQQERSTF